MCIRDSTKTEAELTAIQERIWDDYQLTYLNALEYKKKIVYSESQRRVEEIKEIIRQTVSYTHL